MFYLLSIPCILLQKSFAQDIDAFDMYLMQCKQLVYVVTPSWNSNAGTLTMFERKNEKKKWRCVDSFPVTVGRSGLAWDNATILPKYFTQKIKHEGDGNSPAGLFSLGPVFGYELMEKIQMPFEQVDANDLCVDDIQSLYYNQLIDADTISKKDFASFETMRRKDALYEFGVWVNYNTSPVIPGNGSCIFLHVWNNEASPTSGCTAMSRENLLKLIQWLHAEKNPALLQVSEQK